MSLTEDKLTNKTAVFNEWIARYTELKPYTKDGVPRILKADSLSGFNPPFGPVKTWIDEDRLHEDQIVLCESGEVGARLGDSWLRPRPLCHIERAGSVLQVSSWQHGSQQLKGPFGVTRSA